MHMLLIELIHLFKKIAFVLINFYFLLLLNYTIINSTLQPLFKFSFNNPSRFPSPYGTCF